MDEVPHRVLVALLAHAPGDPPLLGNLLSRPLPPWAFSHLVREFAARAHDTYYYRSRDVEERFLRILSSSLLERPELLHLLRLPVSSEALLAVLEHRLFDHRVEATLAHVLATRPEQVRRDLRPLLSPPARLAVAFGPLAPSLEPLALWKEARKALARFAHCPDAALETLEALSAEWDGTLSELVDTCSALLARR